MHLFIAIVAILFSTQAMAASANPRQVEELRTAMVQNFEACNNENVDALLESCSDKMPSQDEFRDESEKTFAEKDIYYRLVDITNCDVRGEWAQARIVQETITQNDRGSDDEQDEYYREHSGLLTANEVVEYTQTFHKDADGWKLYMITSKPRVLSKSEASKVVKAAGRKPANKAGQRQSVFQTKCQGGQCELPTEYQK